MEDYEQMLIDVKGIGPVTTQEIMAEYPDADALKAALVDGSYEGAFGDELAEAFEVTLGEPPADDENGGADDDQAEEPPEAPAKKATPELSVMVTNVWSDPVRVSNPSAGSLQILPGRVCAVPAKLVKTKQFKDAVADGKLRVVTNPR